ncbi:MAG TPA: diacylglycerol kinase family protein [Gemmatimonadaceae bacterium]|nr:diacylglycerol kinase family protein [Gemmatimonadaceae bacterium]
MEFLAARVLLVVNPAARRAARLERRAVAAFAAAGVSCEIVRTEHPGHGAIVVGAACAAPAREYDAIYSLGGDGTAMEVVGAAAGTGVPVGVLPGGTGNLVARALGIPLRIERAVPALLSGSAREIDLGRLNGGRLFMFAAGVGVDVRMLQGTSPALKARTGVLAYTGAGIAAVLRHRPFTVRVELDDVAIEREAVSVMVANFGTVLSGLLALGPGIREDDGLLDLCVFSPGGVATAARLGWRLFRRDFRPHPGFLFARGARLRVDCVPAQHFQADGEILGITPFDVDVMPHAARLLVPGAVGRRAPLRA